ncbi:MAG: TatD family hydrolase [Flavobacteriaceae bacterium]|jgi:TatD DNase family protein
MKLIDSHTHLYLPDFDEDRDAVIARANALGIDTFLLPAIDASYTSRMEDLKKAYPNQMHLMTGLHPTHVKENYEEELDHVEELLKSQTRVAVGEIGIDLYWDRSFLPQQQIAFDRQIQWAKDHDLPIVIHCRDAFKEVFDVLAGHRGPKLKGIFHCFTGTQADAQQALDCNLLLGIGGVVTFKNGKIDQYIADIPLKHLVLETDAPYLAPTPYRGKRNESAYLYEVVKRLAELYQTTPEIIAVQTTQNLINCFDLGEKK